ncbi:MAG: ribokinase [Firmicutes bacterium]|nr:ribokinase [Bacillota bacterium]
MNRKKIVVVGSFIADITGVTPRFPVDGETVAGRSFTIGPGGKGSNQATAASRLGTEVTLITKTGTDAFSEIASEHYKSEKMSSEFVYRSSNDTTGSCFIAVHEETGENRIIVCKGANESLTKSEVEAAESRIAECDVVLTQLETSLESVGEAIRLAKKHKKPIILNPAPSVTLPSDFFNCIDYFTPNETEAEFYSGVKVENESDARAAAVKIMGLGIKNVIITLGKRGVYFCNGKEEITLPPIKVKAVDTTGAGDAFNGSFAVALSEGRPIKEALAFATCAAGISVTRIGTSNAMPRRDETDKVLFDTFGY